MVKTRFLCLLERGGKVAKLHVVVAYNGQVIEDKILTVTEPVRLGERPGAAMSFPGADILVTSVEGDICWRGRRLREGDTASMELGPLAINVEHVWPERIRYSRAFSGIDLAFVLVLLGVTVSGMWVDTVSRVKQSSSRGDFLEEIGDFRKDFAEAQPWSGVSDRSATLKAGDVEEVLAHGLDFWDGPRAKIDDARSGFGYFEWYRRAVSIPSVNVRAVGSEGLELQDHSDLAAAAYAADNYEAALSHFQWLEAHEPGKASWIEGVAASQKRLGMHRAELRSYAKLLEKNPNHLLAMGNRAVALARLGQMDAAQQALDNLRTLYPYRPFYFHCEAMVYAIRGLETEALGSLEALIASHGALPSRFQAELRRDIAMDPALGSLRSDPRLVELLSRDLQDAPRPI